MRVFYWLSVLAFTSSCSKTIENHVTTFTSTAPVIYGDDDRKDYFEAKTNKRPFRSRSKVSPAGPRGFFMSFSAQRLCYEAVATPLALFTGKINAIF